MDDQSLTGDGRIEYNAIEKKSLDSNKNNNMFTHYLVETQYYKFMNGKSFKLLLRRECFISIRFSKVLKFKLFVFKTFFDFNLNEENHVMIYTCMYIQQSQHFVESVHPV